MASIGYTAANGGVIGTPPTGGVGAAGDETLDGDTGGGGGGGIGGGGVDLSEEVEVSKADGVSIGQIGDVKDDGRNEVACESKEMIENGLSLGNGEGVDMVADGVGNELNVSGSQTDKIFGKSQSVNTLVNGDVKDKGEDGSIVSGDVSLVEVVQGFPKEGVIPMLENGVVYSSGRGNEKESAECTPVHRPEDVNPMLKGGMKYNSGGGNETEWAKCSPIQKQKVSTRHSAKATPLGNTTVVTRRGSKPTLVRRAKTAPATRQAVKIVPHDRCYIPFPDRESPFSASNLVWGKVKSHPWWPGEIFDPSDASEMALKIQKEGKLLIAYFQDKTFAWTAESQLKPFFANFREMEKQSKLEAFGSAVNEVLEEIARRVEVGLTCSCFADEAYVAMKSKTFENAGLQEGTCRAAVDKTLIANSFEPNSLLNYVSTLAKRPFGGADRLELVTVTAHLKSFYRSKGYELCVFFEGVELMDNDDVSTATAEKYGDGIIDPSNVSPPVSSSAKRKSRDKGSSSSKRKQASQDGGIASVKKSGEITDPLNVVARATSSGKSKAVGKGRLSGKRKQTLQDGETASVKKSGDEIIDPLNIVARATSSGKSKAVGKGRLSGRRKQTLQDGGTASAEKSCDYEVIDPLNVPNAASSGKGKSRGNGNLPGKMKQISQYGLDGRIVRVEKSGVDIIDASNVAATSSGKAKSRRGKGSASRKRKQTVHDSEENKLPETMEEEAGKKEVDEDEDEDEEVDKEEDDALYLPSDNGKRSQRRAVSRSSTPDVTQSKKKRLDSSEAMTPSPRSARIGERMSRIASQMKGSPPMIKSDAKAKCSEIASRKSGRKLGADAVNTLAETSNITRHDIESCSSMNEVLEQLLLSARSPTKGHVYRHTFLTDFRTSILSIDDECVTPFGSKIGKEKQANPESAHMEHVATVGSKRGKQRPANPESSHKEHVAAVGSERGKRKRAATVGSKRGKRKRANPKSATVNKSQPGVEDSYWSGLIVRDMPEEDSDYSDVIFQDSPERRESKIQRKQKQMTPTVEEPTTCLETLQDTELTQQSGSKYHCTQQELSQERTGNYVGEKIAMECTLTSLILSFLESNDLPSESDLISIFSRFGPLAEAETEVRKEENRARVVFRTRADAETAYISAVKTSLFGPALVSYRLKYPPLPIPKDYKLDNGGSTDEDAGVAGKHTI